MRLLFILLASIAFLMVAFISCADDVDSADTSDTDSTTSDSTCEDGDETCTTDDTTCETTDEDGNCADDETTDDTTDDSSDETVVCDTADVTSSSIQTRYYSLIPGFDNDSCFLEYYTDRQFLACSAYEIPYTKINGDYVTGPAALAQTLGLDEDEDDLSVIFEEVDSDYDGPYEFLNDYEKSGDHSIYVSGSDCSFTILGVDFLYGQLLDYYAWLDWYYYGSYSSDPYAYGSGAYDPYY